MSDWIVSSTRHRPNVFRFQGVEIQMLPVHRMIGDTDIINLYESRQQMHQLAHEYYQFKHNWTGFYRLMLLMLPISFLVLYVSFAEDDEIRKKIRKGWCEEGLTEGNPVLEIARQVVFHEYDSISIERPEKFGGNVTYNSYEELESDFAQKNLHPGDLKNTIGEYMVKIIGPIRDKISLSDELYDLIKNSH